MSSALELLTVRVSGDVDAVLAGFDQIGSGARRLGRDIDNAQSPFGRLNAELTKSRSLMGPVAGATGFGLAAKSAFELGSAVEETGSKFRTVFGESTDQVQSFIDQFGTLAGLSNEQAQAVLATTGSIVQGMGLAEAAAASFSIEVTKLAGDLSSFNNVPIAETSAAIQAAITGEREQLKRLGIVILETDVQKRALESTGKELVSQLTQEEKAMATLELITERAGRAVGDLERTQDSAANQARQLGAEIQNLKEDMATALLPAMNVGVQGLNAFIKGLQIMGAEAAVTVARIELEFARLDEGGGLKGLLADISGLGKGAGLFDPLGLDLFSRAVGADLGKSVAEAEANLRRMEDAAEAVKLDIVGLARELENAGRKAEGAAERVGEAAPVIGEVAFRAMEAGQFLQVDFTEGLRAAADAADELRGTVAYLPPQAEEVANTYDVFVSELSSGFESIVAGTESVSEAFAAMVQSIIFELARAELRQGLADLIPAGSIGGGGAGSLAVGLLGLAFGGFFAEGGRIGAGQFGIVGESGPEIVSGPATVTPMGGPQVVHHQTVNLNLNAIDGRSAAQFLEQNKGVIAGLMLDLRRESDWF